MSCNLRSAKDQWCNASSISSMISEVLNASRASSLLGFVLVLQGFDYHAIHATLRKYLYCITKVQLLQVNYSLP